MVARRFCMGTSLSAKAFVSYWRMYFCRCCLLPFYQILYHKAKAGLRFSSMLHNPPLKNGLWLIGIFLSSSSARGFLTNLSNFLVPLRLGGLSDCLWHFAHQPFCKWLSGEAKFREKMTFSPLLSKKSQTQSVEEPQHILSGWLGLCSPSGNRTATVLLCLHFLPPAKGWQYTGLLKLTNSQTAASSALENVSC